MSSTPYGRHSVPSWTSPASLVIIAYLSFVIQTLLIDHQVRDRYLTYTSHAQQDFQSNQQRQYSTSQQQDYKNAGRQRVSWCTVNSLERKKCLDWARAIEEVNIQYESQAPFKLNLDCVQGADKDQCMSMIDDERADMILLDPGEIGVAGRYHSLTPIMLEQYGSLNKVEYGHYSVAVVKKRSSSIIQSLDDLFGKRACFSGVSHMASWTLPLATLIDLPRFQIVDCNNLVKSASYFFGNSCAPNALINKFNPTGDNPQSMSQLCEHQLSGRAIAQGESYGGAFSALKCLAEPSTVSYSLGQDLNGPPNRMSSFTTGSGGADVAFLPHNTLFLAEKLSLSREARLEVPSRNELELLCPQGGRAPLDRWQNCNFGFVPAHAVIVSSRTSLELREAIQKFLKTSAQLFSSGPISSSSLVYQQQAANPYDQQRTLGNSNQRQSQSPFDFNYPEPLSPTQLLEQHQQSPSLSGNFKLSTNFKLNGDQALLTYPGLDVLFSSDMIDMIPLVGVGQTFKGFLNSFPVQLATSAAQQSNGNARAPGSSLSYYTTARPFYESNSVFEIRTQTDYFEKLRRCSLPAAVMCITSDKEFSKCQAMSKAFHAAGLKPELNCKLAQSSLACMQLIKNRDADLTVLDAADIYLAGHKFGLMPIVAEQIEMHDPSHYSVAVVKKSDLSTDLFNLKGKTSCHSGFLKGAGWVMPMHFLLSNDRMRRYDDCNSARPAAEHFEKACAPGILSSMSSTHNTSSWTIRNMCELCHGSGRGYCARDATEPFYGDTGSFRCLIEGGGQVAFCKHTTIFENTGGSNRETWARNLIKSDFELLCRDGSRAPVNDYKSCNLGRVPPNAIVTRGDTPFQLVDTYVNLFMYGQQYYGSKYSEEYTFKMFSSTNGRDLIFQDATQRLVRIPLVNQTYRSYLDHEFLRAIECSELS